jgi:hypothetical protein
MKKYLFVSVVFLMLAVLGIAGCGNPPPSPGEETSSCVICHSDKEALQQTATAEVEEKSAETSGEG